MVGVIFVQLKNEAILRTANITVENAGFLLIIEAEKGVLIRCIVNKWGKIIRLFKGFTPRIDVLSDKNNTCRTISKEKIFYKVVRVQRWTKFTSQLIRNK